MILDENVKAISLGVLQQIDLDLVQCEQFAASEPIQGLEVLKGFFYICGDCLMIKHGDLNLNACTVLL